MNALEKQAAAFADGAARGGAFLDAVMRKASSETCEPPVAQAIPKSADHRPSDLPEQPAPDARDGGHAPWPRLQPLTEDIEPIPYPIDALPGRIRDAVEQVADEVQAPLALIACSALAVISVAAQGQVDVQRAPHLRSPTSLFLLVIADSGERKSASDKRMTEALLQYERAALARATPALKRHRAETMAWDARCEGVLQQIRRAAKDNGATQHLEARLLEMEQTRPQPPRVPRLVYSDVTPEGLTYGLAKHWPSAGILSNEAGIVFGSHGMSGESVMRNLAQVNTLWDGGKIRVDRRTSDSYVVDGARLTMGLMVQEQTLRRFFDQNLTLARGSGFLARFLVACPDSKMGTRLYREPNPDAIGMRGFNERLSEILAMPLPVDENGLLSPRIVNLSPAARRLWIAYYNLTESQIGVTGDLHEIRDVVGKAAENAARIAGLLHFFGGAQGDIDEDTMERACRISAWHLNESRRLFTSIELPREVSDALRLTQWLQRHCSARRSNAERRSEIQRRVHGDLRNRNRFKAAIDLLIRRGHIRALPPPHQTLLELHPTLRLPEAPG